MSTTTLKVTDISGLDQQLKELSSANRRFAATYCGESPDRQPVHTVYGGAHLFKRGTAQKLGELAQGAFAEYCQGSEDLAKIFGIEPELAKRVFDRVKAKLAAEAVEDFRIDFEDGFGNRPDEEEDEVAVKAATEVAAGVAEKSLSPFIGIRIKSLSDELKKRSLRTLNLFLTQLCEKGQLPENFFVTAPKVVNPEQIAIVDFALTELEKQLGLPKDRIKLEIMIEQTQTIMGADGRSMLPLIANAAGSRLIAAHFGTYDYTASCNITASHQEMDHPACDFARNMMKIAYGTRPIWLSDGATNVMPVGNLDTVHNAWRLHYRHTRHSLRNGYYQGWDLHPAQLPVRYIACYSFFLESLGQATDRLKGFIDKAAQATLLGDVFDDAATGQGLLNYFLRALNCGAVTMDEVAKTGLTLEEVRSRSFLKILEMRK